MSDDDRAKDQHDDDGERSGGDTEIDIPMVSLSELLEENDHIAFLSMNDNDGTVLPTSTVVVESPAAVALDDDDDIAFVGEASIDASSKIDIESNIAAAAADTIMEEAAANEPNEAIERIQVDSLDDIQLDESVHLPPEKEELTVKEEESVASIEMDPSVANATESDVVILLDDDEDDREKMAVDKVEVKTTDEAGSVDEVSAVAVEATVAVVDITSGDVAPITEIVVPEANITVVAEPDTLVPAGDDIIMLEDSPPLEVEKDILVPALEGLY